MADKTTGLASGQSGLYSVFGIFFVFGGVLFLGCEKRKEEVFGYLSFSVFLCEVGACRFMEFVVCGEMVANSHF